MILDLDIVVAANEIEEVRKACTNVFKAKEYAHRINLCSPGSDLRIQIQTDNRYQAYIDRAQERNILGYSMQAAKLEDVFQGKVWAYSDEAKRKSKRQKDLADIFRIIEEYPSLKSNLPENIRRMI